MIIKIIKEKIMNNYKLNYDNMKLNWENMKVK